MARQIIPLRERKGDIFLIAFFLVNVLFITYIVDLEQLVVPDASNFTYPVWPPKFFIDLNHWYGQNIDPLQFMRPVWWKMTIWIDVLFFGPYYVCAIYSFIRGREGIRIPSLIASSMLITNVIIILGEEAYGPYRTPKFLLVFLLNLPWLLAPAYNIYRMAKSEHPFTRTVAAIEGDPESDPGPLAENEAR